MWEGFTDTQKRIITIVLGVILVGMVLAVIGGFFDAEKQKWIIGGGIIIQALGSAQVGAWAQALGAMAAVFAAVWVMHRQHHAQVKRDDEREKADERKLLLGIKSELEVFSDYIAGIREIIKNTPENQPILIGLPTIRDPFSIFQGYKDRIEQVKNKQLRKKIIIVYRHATDFFYSLFILGRYEFMNSFSSSFNLSFEYVVGKQSDLGLKRYMDVIQEVQTNIRKAHIIISNKVRQDFDIMENHISELQKVFFQEEIEE